MKTIIENGTNCSKYLFADDVSVVIGPEYTKATKPDGSGPIIGDMNASNATLVEGVTEPDDWVGCKYNYVNGAWELCPDWTDPRLWVDPRITRIYSAMLKDVDLINGVIAGNEMTDESEEARKDLVSRKYTRLEHDLNFDFWTDQDMTPVNAAIAAGKAYCE
tara:strand:+ start:110 stop:595 length:486 start_codon:yes stop_codon:yes gene_type:complete